MQQNIKSKNKKDTMKVFVVGLNSKNLEKTLLENGFELDSKNPEIVFTYGGDGTILFAERIYPKTPKVTVKHSQFCYKCKFKESNINQIITAIKNKSYKLQPYLKLEAKLKEKTMVALNEIQIHNKKPTKAVRFNVSADKKPVFENVVADGVVVSTSYGSGAYFSSVGGKTFKNGIGIALNNSHKKEKPVIVDENSTIEITIIRETAHLISDNDDNMLTVKNQDTITIKKYRKTANFVVLDN